MQRGARLKAGRDPERAAAAVATASGRLVSLVSLPAAGLSVLSVCRRRVATARASGRLVSDSALGRMLAGRLRRSFSNLTRLI